MTRCQTTLIEIIGGAAIGFTVTGFWTTFLVMLAFLAFVAMIDAMMDPSK
jgi:hypothetical protein